MTIQKNHSSHIKVLVGGCLGLMLSFLAQAQPVVIPREVYNIDEDLLTGKEVKTLIQQYRNASPVARKSTEDECLKSISPWDVDSMSVFPHETYALGRSLKEYLCYRKAYYVPLRCDTLTKDGNDVGLYEAYNAGWYGNEEIIVAIVDTGLTLDIGFPEERHWVNEDEIYNNGIDDDNNGYVDDRYGYSFADSTHLYEVLVNDNNVYHGTHMHNVVGASGALEYSDNDTWGYAPDQRCKLMNLKVNYGKGINSISAIAQAIKYAADNGAKIINISIGDNTIKPSSWDDLSIAYDSALTASMDYAWDKGCLLVSAAGNVSGTDFILQKSHYNGVANHPAVISIGSIHNNLMGFSQAISYSGKKNDLVTFTYVSGSGAIMPGTSASSAFTAGLIALYWGKHTHLTNVEVKKNILESARDQIYDVGEKEDLIALEDDGSRYELLKTGQEPSKFFHHTKNDVPGKDDYYGYGLLSLAELVNGVKYREVTIDPETGAADGYTRPTEVLEEDYDLLAIPLTVDKPETTISIYPNPVKDHLHIISPKGKPVNVKVYSLLGNLILEKNYITKSLYLGNLYPGIYMVEINNQWKQKIIKL